MPSICTNDAVNLYYEEAVTGTPIHGRVGRACASEPARCPGGRREYRALDRESGGGGLLRCRWKRRQFGDVPRIVLNYHRGLEVGRRLLETIEGCERIPAVVVEGGHPVAFIILVKVCEVAGNEHVAHSL
jgi:hypothetical protein